MIAGGAPVDLRSDTVTRPTPAMRRAMADAPVGDAVYGEDPTVARLEAMAAERLGTEGALFVASGTMANQLAIATGARPGDEICLHEGAHPLHHEAGGAAANAGVQLMGIGGADGRMDEEALRATIRPDKPSYARTTMLLLENTHNGAGGRPLPAAHVAHLARIGREAAPGLLVHVDGARLFNAAIALGVSAASLVEAADSACFCLSKGLGAPVGSLLCASRDRLASARRVRERLGGAWRQAGILAAAGIHALEHHVTRLADDHARAARLADAITALGGWRAAHPVETNLIYLDAFDDRRLGGAALAEALRDEGVLANATGPRQIRLVTHLGVTDRGIQRAIAAFTALARRRPA